jgi:hypothetical protein
MCGEDTGQGSGLRVPQTMAGVRGKMSVVTDIQTADLFLLNILRIAFRFDFIIFVKQYCLTNNLKAEANY